MQAFLENTVNNLSIRAVIISHGLLMKRIGIDSLQ